MAAHSLLERGMHRDGMDEKDVLADLRNWNEAKVLGMKEWLTTLTGSELETAQERIRQYEGSREVA